MSETLTPIEVGFGILGIALVAGAGYLIYKNINNAKDDKEKLLNKIINDKDRYNSLLNGINKAIERKDWDMLEQLKDSTAKYFPDLIEKIEKALKNKDN